MFRNQFDVIFIGKTPLSLWHALCLQEKQTRVLVVDTPFKPRVWKKPQILSALEVDMLEQLAEQRNWGIGIDFSALLKKHHFHLQTNSTHLLLGAGVKENVTELLRKWPTFRTEELEKILQRSDTELEKDLKEERLSFISWFLKNSKKKTSASYIPQKTWIKLFHDQLSSKMKEEYEGESKALEIQQQLQLFIAGCDHQLRYNFAPEEAYYLTLKILSPLFSIDEYKWEQEFSSLLQTLGGNEISSSIESWQFYHGRFTHLLLSRYEGVARAEKVFVYSEDDEIKELKLFLPLERLSSIKGRVQLNVLASLGWTQVESEVQNLGTKFPYLLAHRDLSSLLLEAPFPTSLGTKSDFFHAELCPKLQAMLPIWQLSADLPVLWGEGRERLGIVGPLGRETLKGKILRPVKDSWCAHGAENETTGVEYWGHQRFPHFTFMSHLASLAN